MQLESDAQPRGQMESMGSPTPATVLGRKQQVPHREGERGDIILPEEGRMSSQLHMQCAELRACQRGVSPTARRGK